MPSSPKLYTIQEYGGFVQSQQPVPGYQILPESSFQALEDYLLQSRGLTDQSEAVDFLSLSVRRGIGKVITAKNYVGVIALKDGTVIEIGTVKSSSQLWTPLIMSCCLFIE